MQKHHRLAGRIAAHFPIHLMAIAGIEHAAVIRINRGIQAAQAGSGSHHYQKSLKKKNTCRAKLH